MFGIEVESNTGLYIRPSALNFFGVRYLGLRLFRFGSSGLA